MILQVKVKGFYDKLLQEYIEENIIESNELAGYAPYFLHFTQEYLNTFDSDVVSFTKENFQDHLETGHNFLFWKSWKFFKRGHSYPIEMPVFLWTMLITPNASTLMDLKIYLWIFQSEQLKYWSLSDLAMMLNQQMILLKLKWWGLFAYASHYRVILSL